ncbi:MAG: cytochrome c [Halieaceae bacterium]|nr:cytochrome c [Halieaceae bacterium]
MRKHLCKILLAVTTVAVVTLSPAAISHLNDKEVPQSYRQSWFTMIALNFGPMVAMVKGEIPWNDDQMTVYADELAILTSMDGMRGFADGSDKGTTRAKPGIWENKEDFKAKMDDMAMAVKTLQTAANSGDRKAIAGDIAATGKACKACHDEYKSKDYLY